MKAHAIEVRKTLILAFPMIIGQLASMAMAITDAAMVGRGAGTQSLAALTFALNFVHIPYISLWGIVSAASITLAQVYGAKQYQRMPEVLRHGMVLAVGVALVFISGMLVFYQFLPVLPWKPWLGQEPEIVRMAEGYLYCYSAAFITYLLGGSMKGACESQNRPWLPLWVMAGAIALNVLLNWVLIYGHLGAPALGLTGAGVATLLSNICFVIAMVTMVTRKKTLGLPFREVFKPELRWKEMRHLIDLGLPTSVQIAMEVGAFVVAAMLIGSISPVSLAAHHITLQVAAFSFMVPLGMSFAVSIRVSHAAGTGDMQAVRRIGVGALFLVAGWMVIAALLIMTLRYRLAGFFTTDPAVLRIAVGFLAIAALFQVFDGVQSVGIGGLRGLRDVRVPTVFVIINYWGLSLPLAYLLGFPLGYGGMGIWAALAMALALAAVAMTARFWVMSGRPPHPSLLESGGQ